MTKESRFSLSNIVEKIKNTILGFKQSSTDKPEKQAVDTVMPSAEDLSSGKWKKHSLHARDHHDHNEQLVTKLDYYIYTPATTADRPTTKGMPLVVMLHGCTQNATAFAEGTKMNFLAQQEGFVVLYPQQSISHNLGKCWRWFDLTKSQGMAEAHSMMKAIQSAIAMHELDPAKVFVAGMSAGAGMASILAASYPKDIHAIALHSGPALAVAQHMKGGVDLLKNGLDDSDDKSIASLEAFAHNIPHKTPALIIHGMVDDVVHLDNAEALTKQFLYLNDLALDTEASSSEHLVGTEKEYTQTEYKDNQKTIVEVIKVKNLSHAWSGGDKKYPFNSNQGPQSSRIIWDFFKKSL